MRPVLECKFACGKCGLTDVSFFVPVRGSEETLEHWMNVTFAGALVEAHNELRPDCVPETMDEVKIPSSETGVGFLP